MAITAMTAFRLVTLITLLYFFVCSLDFLSSAFRLLGGKAAGQVFSNSELLKNPVVGLMIGVLVTVLVQSSSTSTSITVTMVGSDLITVRTAIPIIMGANIGTSVTNTIVSLMQVADRNQFRRAFAAATVHDMFNWLTVFILLPLEASTRYLETLTTWMVKGTDYNQDDSGKGGAKPAQFLNKLTKPFTRIVIQLDKSVIEKIATNRSLASSMSLVKRCCSKDKTTSAAAAAGTCDRPCAYLFNLVDWSDTVTGIVLLAVSLVMLCMCLVLMVKVLHAMLKGRIALVIKKTINAEYEFPYSIIIGYVAIVVGCIMTILVQSSSIFTSALTPLAGLGVISLERIYPLTLGANIGTTTTGIIAAFAAGGGSKGTRNAVQLAFCHLFFNLSGILLFYPLPFMRFPIPLARVLGNTTARYRWFSVAYLILMFFIVPLFVFSLSTAGTTVFLAIGGPLFITFILVILLNVLQRKRRNWLPMKFQTWDWLPLWMHSLDPLDHQITRLGKKFSCLSCCIQPTTHHYGGAPITSNPSQLHILDPLVNDMESGLSPIPSQLHIYDDERELSPQLTWPQGSKFRIKRKDGPNGSINGGHYIALDMVGYDNYAYKDHKHPPRSHSGSRSSSPSSSPSSPLKMRFRRSNTLPCGGNNRKVSPNRTGSCAAATPPSSPVIRAPAPRRSSVAATGPAPVIGSAPASHFYNHRPLANNNLNTASKSSSDQDNDTDVLVTKL